MRSTTSKGRRGAALAVEIKGISGRCQTSRNCGRRPPNFGRGVEATEADLKSQNARKGPESKGILTFFTHTPLTHFRDKSYLLKLISNRCTIMKSGWQ